MAFFTTFGSFSIAAGILLIFLVFVMLATERRGELGIARAIGTRRGHLVQTFTFEGAAYDLLAALVGALLGAAFAFLMVFVMAAAFDTAAGEGLEHRVRGDAEEPRNRLRARRAAHPRRGRGLGLAGEHDDDLGGDPQPPRATFPEAAPAPRARRRRARARAHC